MAESPLRFAELLTTALHRVKAVEGKPILVIQDELGYLVGREGGSIVEYWRKGHLPLRLADVELLGRTLVARGQLDRAWLMALLTSAGHPAPDRLCDALFAAPAAPEPAAPASAPVAPVAAAAPTLPAAGPPPQLRPGAWPLDRLPEPAPLPHGSIVPLSRNPFFVGRTQDLLALARALATHTTAAISPVETAAATGLGGIGKTQLASEFVHRYGQYFPGGVFWLRFELEHAIPAEVARCGGAAGMALRPDFALLALAEQVALVQAAWQGPEQRLLVFDNCEDPALVQQWRPVSGGCRVLITSRQGEWEPLLGVEQAQLGVFARAESVALLRRHVAHADDAVLDAIAATLGDLPLALHLAGSYLHRYRRAVTPQQYLNAVRDQALLNHPSLQGTGISPTAHLQHVGRTFAVSYERLQPAEARDVRAQRLLMHMACFAPGEPVWYDVLVRTLELDPRVAEDAVAAEDAYARLIELGLVQVEAEESMRIHRLVAAFVRTMAPEQALAAQHRIEATVLSGLERANRSGTPLTLVSGNVHIRHVADQALEREPAQGAVLVAALARHLEQSGDLEGALAEWRRVLAVRRAEAGGNSEAAGDSEAVGDSEATAPCHHHIGRLLAAQSRYGEARAHLEQALALQVARFGEQHADSTQIMGDLSECYWFLGEAELALSTLERAYAICLQVLGPDDLGTCYVANNLGIMLIDGPGKHEQARPYLEHALNVRRQLLGDLHPDIAESYHNLGYVLEQLGQNGAAQAAYEEALAIRRFVWTDDHRDTVITLSMLGALLMRMGKRDEARGHLEKAVEVANRVLGDGDLVTAVSHTELSKYLEAAGNLEGARTHMRRALAIREAVYGEDSLSVALSLLDLASLCTKLGQIEEGRRLLQRACRARERLLGTDHPETETVRALLAALDQRSTALEP